MLACSFLEPEKSKERSSDTFTPNPQNGYAVGGKAKIGFEHPECCQTETQGDVSVLFTPPSAFSRQCKSPSSKREARDDDEGRWRAKGMGMSRSFFLERERSSDTSPSPENGYAVGGKAKIRFEHPECCQTETSRRIFSLTPPSAFSLQCKSPSSKGRQEMMMKASKNVSYLFQIKAPELNNTSIFKRDRELPLPRTVMPKWAVKPRLVLQHPECQTKKETYLSLFTPPSAFSRQCKSPSSKRRQEMMMKEGGEQ
ncbi:hypothetical protein CEXT_148841 [Caerostris extrusa]|uniref:Uncharacterized protein n=1 Tax=Caerostris extrusa TaxID=172846 RepID=A0AAV4RSW1_CAEEX|nr:hypothetical protein CEXT_148841 [Caerostris extrusa]